MALLAAVLFLLSCLSLLIWCVLLFARGGFWRARPAAPLALQPRETWPAVAAVVPARNEVDVIAEAVTTLLQQDYSGDFHVIVVDDHSTDGTADAARAAALQLQCPDRLTVLTARSHCLRAGRARCGRSHKVSRRCARSACPPTSCC